MSKGLHKTIKLIAMYSKFGSQSEKQKAALKGRENAVERSGATN